MEQVPGKQRNTQTKARSIVFTLNNYTDSEVEEIKRINHKYMVFGYEVAPKTGTPHLQGYIQFKNPRSFNAMKNRIKRWNISIAKGSAAQNFDYCTKSGKYFENGIRPRSGTRTDLNKIKERILSGEHIAPVARDCINYQQIKYAETLYKYVPIKVLYRKVYVKWYWGRTGYGKTRTAVEEFNGNCWISSRNLKWWDGYCDQKNIILDDFRGDFCTFHELLRILDGYPFRAEIKCSSVQTVYDNIIVTSARHPRDVYLTVEDTDQLMRRIDEIKYFGPENGTEVGEGNTAVPATSPPLNLLDIL